MERGTGGVMVDGFVPLIQPERNDYMRMLYGLRDDKTCGSCFHLTLNKCGGFELANDSLACGKWTEIPKPRTDANGEIDWASMTEGKCKD
jgi:hypothetical protein